MKSTLLIFKECADAVSEQFGEADSSERLKASIALVELTMRGIVESINENRWEQSLKQQQAMSQEVRSDPSFPEGR